MQHKEQHKNFSMCLNNFSFLISPTILQPKREASSLMFKTSTAASELSKYIFILGGWHNTFFIVPSMVIKSVA